MLDNAAIHALTHVHGCQVYPSLTTTTTTTTTVAVDTAARIAIEMDLSHPQMTQIHEALLKSSALRRGCPICTRHT
jgi:hypothetical protein